MKAPNLPVLSLEAWKAQKSAGPVCVRRTFEVERDADGAMSIVMSSATEDRMGDTIAVSGWRLDNFKSNPVLLWGHDSFAPPIGKVSSVVVEGNALKAKRVEWVPKEVSEFAWTIQRLVELGFVRAVSVGFRPLKWAFRDDGGVDFAEQELLELSFVSIPANPEALVESKAVDVTPVDQWAAKLIASGDAGLSVDGAKAWLGSRAAALAKAHPNQADDSTDEAPLPEIVNLTEAMREQTAVMRDLLVAVRENTAIVKGVTSPQPLAQTARKTLAEDLVSAVRSAMHHE